MHVFDNEHCFKRSAQRSRIKMFPFLGQTDLRSDDELDILP